jgi:uncharacterized membrane protein YfcA
MLPLALLGMGWLAGVFGAILGLGGGIFLVPILTLVFHLSIHLAVGTSLMGVIATSAGVAAVTAPGRGADLTLALRLEVATVAGAIAGGWLASEVSHQALSLLFAGVVFCTAIYVLSKEWSRRSDGKTEQLFTQAYRPRRWAAGLAISVFAGMVSGLLGVGGGFIKVPIMYALMDVPLGIATTTSNFMVGITAAASLFVYYGRGDIHPWVVVPTTLGVFIGAICGVYVSLRLRVSWVRRALIGLLLILGVQMLLHSLHS